MAQGRFGALSIWVTLLAAQGAHAADELRADVVVDVTVATRGRCPGQQQAIALANETLTLCYRIENRTDRTLTAVAIVDGDRSISVRSLGPRKSVAEQRKLKVTKPHVTTAAATAQIDGKAAHALVWQARLALPPDAKVKRAPPKELAKLALTLPGEPWGVQPNLIEVVTTSGSKRTCNGVACVCSKAGDRVRVLPLAGQPFPPIDDDHPFVVTGLELNCAPLPSGALKSSDWSSSAIELDGDKLTTSGLVALRRRPRNHSLNYGAFLERCRLWTTRFPGVPFAELNAMPAAPSTLSRSSFLFERPMPQGFRLPKLRPIPAGDCLPKCSALCVDDGAGGCKNQLLVGDGAGVGALWAANGTAPAWKPSSVIAPPTKQWVPGGQPISLGFLISPDDGFPLLDATLLRDGAVEAVVNTFAPADGQGAIQGSINAGAITRKTTFTLRTRTAACGDSAISARSITLMPESNVGIDGPDPIELSPGESVTLQLFASGAAGPLDVGVFLSEEVPPAGSDIFPHVFIKPSTGPLTLAANGAKKPITLTLEDSNTGIAGGTLIAMLELRPTSPLGPSQWREIRFRAPAPTGFAETHAHPFSNAAFGANGPNEGAILRRPDGPESDLVECSKEHGPDATDDLFGLGFGEGPHFNGGHASFLGWPSFTTGTHQQMKTEWIKRAYDGGLRVMVALAVENRVLCALKRSGLTMVDVKNLINTNVAAPFLVALNPLTWRALDKFNGALASCNAHYQMQSVRHQLDLAHNFANKNEAWVRIVRNGAEAAQAIRDEKLALVLGVEMGPLFECEKDGECNDATWLAQQVQVLHNADVRYVFLAHKEDNSFGGPSNMPMTALEKSQPCALIGSRECNTRGLTPAGEKLLDAVVKKGWFVDIDHMSIAMKDAVIAKLRKPEQENTYPVVAGHVSILEFEKNDGRHEGNRTAGDFDAIRMSGGMVSPILDPGSSSESFDYAHSDGREWSCVHSSDTFAQQLRFAARVGRGRPVGIGTDFNGFGGLVAPQYGPLRCASGKGVDYGVPKVAPPYVPVMVTYPLRLHYVTPAGAAPAVELREMQIGARTYDINYDGVAQFGMLPDFIDELALRGSDVLPLMRSADAFARTWRKQDCIAGKKNNDPELAGVTCPR